MYFKISFIIAFCTYNLSGIQAGHTLTMIYTDKEQGKTTKGVFTEKEVYQVGTGAEKKYRFVFRDSIFEKGFQPDPIMHFTWGTEGWNISFVKDEGSAVQLIKPNIKQMFYIPFVKRDVTDGYTSFVDGDKTFLVVSPAKTCVVFEAEST